MEKYYGSKGRYTCNGYMPISERRQRRKNRSYIGWLFISMALFVILLIMFLAIDPLIWIQMWR